MKKSLLLFLFLALSCIGIGQQKTRVVIAGPEIYIADREYSRPERGFLFNEHGYLGTMPFKKKIFLEGMDKFYVLREDSTTHQFTKAQIADNTYILPLASRVKMQQILATRKASLAQIDWNNHRPSAQGYLSSGNQRIEYRVVQNILNTYMESICSDTASTLYELRAKIINIDIDEVYNTWGASVPEKVFVNVDWSIADPVEKLPFYIKETLGIARSPYVIPSSDPKMGSAMSLFNIVTASAIQSSLKTFLQDSTVARILSGSVDNLQLLEIEEEEFYSLKLKSDVAVKSSLENAISSSVSISTPNGFGSGFFFHSEGYILTNAHVVNDNQVVKVILENGLTLDGDVLAVDIEVDVAVVKLPLAGVKPVVIEPNFERGQDVYAIGTPTDLVLGQTLTKGIISGYRESESYRLIQTDVSISPGNSGGPLVNQEGKVIGIVSSKIITEGAEGIGFAIPIQVALDALNITFTEP